MTMSFKSGVVTASGGGFDIRWGLYCQQPVCERFIVFINGRSEWIEKYHDLPDLLNLPIDCGFLSLDHRGQGASGGTRGSVEDYKFYVEDLTSVVNQIVGEAPYVALAHSMGALILSLAILQDKLHPQAMVLASPFFGLPRIPLHPWFATQLAKSLHALHLGKRRLGASGRRVGGFEGNRLTHDQARFEAMQHNPYPIPATTIQWVNESVRAIKTIHREDLLQQLTVPTLVMMGSEDTIVDYQAPARWVTRVRSLSKTDIQYEEFAGARHELLSEIDHYRLPAIEMIQQWFAAFLR